MMAMSEEIPLLYRIIALMQERNRLYAFPLEKIAAEIRSTGFRCDCCGNCCTRAVNNHIFLLDHDVAELKKIDPTAYEPAPGPEFCDQNGSFYVSGYALRMKNEVPGSCWFLENGKCRIYDQRFSACRTYPHMLRRDTDLSGRVLWRQFAHLNEHGHYDPALSEEDSLAIARQIKEYENAFLNQQISFLETIHDYFTVYDLHHEAEVYERQMQCFLQGMPVDIHVFDNGELEKYRIVKSV
jgi:hypothetical protein